MSANWCESCSAGKASSDMPALEPYWGKPAVRNLRGDDGDVGIIRSPVRAFVLPDRRKGSCNLVVCGTIGWERTRRRTLKSTSSGFQSIGSRF